MKQIVFSTHNENKLNEIKKILSDNFKILGLIDLNFNDEIIESGKTLAQNADIKASHINKLYNIDCFADDTGLEIDSLNGEPEFTPLDMLVMSVVQKKILKKF